jgi:hypothetical protein
MAHSAAHHEIVTIKRSQGQSATARVAYVCRSTIYDDRTGETHRYRDDGDLAAVQIVGHDDSPADFANRLEAAEKRRDGQVGRSSILALPNELSDTASARVVFAYQTHLQGRYGCASVSAVHRKDGNHHAHIVEDTRDADGSKITVLTDKRTSGKEVEHRRQTWAEIVNAELAKEAPQSKRVDHRSLVRRRLAGDTTADRPAVPHLGPAKHAATRKQPKGKDRPVWALDRVRDGFELLTAASEVEQSKAKLDLLKKSSQPKPSAPSIAEQALGPMQRAAVADAVNRQQRKKAEALARRERHKEQR